MAFTNLGGVNPDGIPQGTAAGQQGMPAGTVPSGMMPGFTQTGATTGFGQAGFMPGTAQQGWMPGFIQPGAMTGMGQSGFMPGTAMPGSMAGYGQQGMMPGFAQPGTMAGAGQAGWMPVTGQQGTVTGLSQPAATSQVPQIPAGSVIPGVPGTAVPGQLPVEESYIENILRLNLGKVATIYMTFENNEQWNAKVFRGVLEAAGRDHIVIRDPETGIHYLLLMVNLDYVTFEEELNYTLPYGIVTT